MSETNVPDPWINQSEINIDDGGGDSFKSGYDRVKLIHPAITLPKYAGYWKIGENYAAYVLTRPSRLNRLMTKFLLGWEWVDT